MEMTSNKPYLIRCFYDWIVDNQLTPYLIVDASYPGVQIPTEYVYDGRLVLNISPAATRGLLLENDRIVFTARFSGQAQQIYIPPNAVLEIYAKENGRGIAFSVEPTTEPPPDTSAPAADSGKAKPSLKLVK